MARRGGMCLPDGAVLEHDGSFSCFLCCVAECLNSAREGLAPPAVKGPLTEPGLFEERTVVARDDARAGAVWRRLAAKAGEEAMLSCLAAFSSDLEGADEAAARLLARVWREGGGALNDLSDAAVLLVEKAAVRTRAVAHLMKGLVRFSELSDGSWYAGIAPDCDVLSFLGDHFQARFPSDRWAIHDRRRSSAIIHEPGSGWRLVMRFSLASAAPGESALSRGATGRSRGEVPSVSLYSAAELELRESWAAYHASVAISERVNPALQASHMPKKYWPDLPEMRRDDSARR